MSKRRFRLYAEFASGGNLATAVRPYNHIWLPRVPSRNYIPESFVWYILKALATALLLLQNGTLGDEPIADWKPIMHLDMHNPNILLDVQTKKRKRPTDDASDSASDSASADPAKRQKVGSSSDKHKVGTEILLITTTC